MKEDSKPRSRRGFLADLGRLAVGGGMVGGITALARRDGEQCTNNSRCRKCGRLGDCHLPAANSVRSAVKREAGKRVDERG